MENKKNHTLADVHTQLHELLPLKTQVFELEMPSYIEIEVFGLSVVCFSEE